jgi:hypothetical protein
MQRVTIERTSPYIPPLIHRDIQALQCRLLFGRQDPPLVHWREASDRDTVAGDDEILAGFDFTNAVGKGLVRVMQTECLGHGRVI